MIIQYPKRNENQFTKASKFGEERGNRDETRGGGLNFKEK